MDVLSHFIIGETFGIFQNSLKDNLIVASFGVLPDLTHVPLYFYVGYLNKRFLWWPKNADWYKHNFRQQNPKWSALWELPHSFLFLLFFITPIVLYFNLPKMAILSYGSHIFLDLFTHTSEWGVKPFYPFAFKFKGFADVWTWGFKKLVLCWTICLCLLLIVYLLK